LRCRAIGNADLMPWAESIPLPPYGISNPVVATSAKRHQCASPNGFGPIARSVIWWPLVDVMHLQRRPAQVAELIFTDAARAAFETVMLKLSKSDRGPLRPV